MIPTYSQVVRALRSAASIKASTACGLRRAPSPLIMVWEATDRCNSDCSYCSMRRFSAEEADLLTTEEIKRVISEAESLGVSTLVISGGEPLLRDDVGEVARFARDMGIFVSMTTNGTLLDQKTLGTALECDHLTISIDSIDRNDYARRRGLDALDDALNGVRMVARRRRRPTVQVQAVLDRGNWRDISLLNRFFYALGVDSVFQMIYDEPFSIDEMEWCRMVEALRYHSVILGLLHRRFLGLFPRISRQEIASPCLALTSNFVVSPTGALLSCNYRREAIADLRSESLLEVWPGLKRRRQVLASAERSCTCANTCFTIPAMLLS